MPHGWTASLLPEAAVLCMVAGVAAGVIGARIAVAVGGTNPPTAARGRAPALLVAASAVAILVCLAIPLPRHGDSTVRATIVPHDVAAGSARLRIEFSKADYSRGAERFGVLAWQGGSSKRIALDRYRRPPTRPRSAFPTAATGSRC